MKLEKLLETLRYDPFAPLDVGEIGLLLAQDEYPTLDVDGYQADLDSWAGEARRFLTGDASAQIAGLCRYLFHELGFHGNTKEFYDPRNSYLSDVLDRRTGIPITLTAVAMALGRRLGLEIGCLGLPGHVVAVCPGENEPILFDPFHGGRRLSVVDCENLVRQTTGMELTLEGAALEPLPLGFMVQRMLNNLRGIYFKANDWRRALRTLRRIVQLNPEESQLQRDLGVCYLRTDEPGRAFAHLQRYQRQTPDAADAEEVRQWMLEAERALAKWN